MRRHTLIGAGLSALLLAAPQIAVADDDDDDFEKVGDALEAIYEQSMEMQQRAQSADPAEAEGDAILGTLNVRGRTLELATATPDGRIVIDAVASGDTADLVAEMEVMGATRVSSYGRVVSAAFPATKIRDLAGSPYLAFAQPAKAMTNVGATTSQGDRSMRTDVVRNQLGLDGAGTIVGVLSDSFNCDVFASTTQADDIASGDLPAEIINLSDITSGCIDEGRGMAQLIHDVAPGASIAFYSAFNGQADFANGIVALAEAGADVIVDDIIYLFEPMFQDGIIAQAVDEVNRLGVPYYSSNGNNGRDAFESEYRPISFDGSTFHDFDPGPGEDPLMEIQLTNFITELMFNWDSPNFSVSGGAGAQNDIDLVLYDTAGNRIPDCFPALPDQCIFRLTDGGAGGDAIERAWIVNFPFGVSTVNLGIETQAGDPAGYVKFVSFDGNFFASEYPVNAGSGYGHSNAAGGEGVGAASFHLTEEFIGDPLTLDVRTPAGEPLCVPACLNDFSSAGGTPILFDTDGNRLAQPDIRLKPGITGPDGGNTTFFITDTSVDDDDMDGDFLFAEAGEFPNFFGTSASAPHAAAIAALMIEGERSQIRRVRPNGTVRIRMCALEDMQGSAADFRNDGNTRNVNPANVSARIADGWVLGPCSRSEPSVVRDAMRSTAQNMTVRANRFNGQTLGVFDEIGTSGFDFDSGFGFVDAKKAIDAFLDQADNEGNGG